MGRWCCRLRPSNNTGKVKSSTTPSKSLYSDSLASQKYEAQKKLEFLNTTKIAKIEDRNVLTSDNIGPNNLKTTH